MSEALRLADLIERYNPGVHSQSIIEDYTKASAELRRLHAEVEALRAEVERLRKDMTVPTIELNSQTWAGMDGAIAFHLIERHADSWADAGQMMREWLDANAARKEST